MNMEMTPVDPRDKKSVSSGDGATPQGRDLSSASASQETQKNSVIPDPRDIVKRELPVDQTAKTIAAMLRRADPNLDAQTAANLAKKLLERTPPVIHKDDEEKEAKGQTLDVSA
jgi:hypothetical protein